MKALIQRVKKAAVRVDGIVVGSINAGTLIFLGIKEEDSDKEIEYIANKVITLRIFEDHQGKMNLSLLDIKGELLVVSQFTLYGNCEKGRRPSFVGAAEPQKAEQMYERFTRYIKSKYDIKVKTGVFGANMEVELLNDGPVTFMIESR